MSTWVTRVRQWKGWPSITTTSASLPGAREPSRFPTPQMQAALMVMAARASSSSRPGGHGGAEGEQGDGGLRVIGADGNLHPRPGQNGGVLHGEILKLRLAPVGEEGPRDDGDALPGQKVRDAVALGAVDHGAVQPELLGQPDGGGDVVRPVGVEVGGQAAGDHRAQGVQPGVEVRLVQGGVRRSPGVFRLVVQRLGELLSDELGGGHAAGAARRSVVPLGVLPQGELHGGGGAHRHLVDERARGFEQDGLPADGVGGAGPGVDAGDSRPPGFLKVAVEGVRAVQRPKLRGAGGGAVVEIVLPLAAAVQPQMAVGVDEAGQDVAPAGVDEAGPGVLRQLRHGARLGDAAALDEDEAVGDGAVFHGVDDAVDDEHGDSSLSCGERAGFDEFFPPAVVCCSCGARPWHGSIPCGHSILPRKYTLGLFSRTGKRAVFYEEGRRSAGPASRRDGGQL